MSVTREVQIPTDRPPQIGLFFRILVETAFALHLVAAAFYWWLSPKGFPVHHSRFWLNGVIPVLVMAIAGVGLAGAFRQRRRITAIAALCFSSGWVAASLTAHVVFPLSLRGFWVVGLLAAILGAGYVALVVPCDRRTVRIWLPLSIPSVFVGIFVVWAQLPPPPSTRPMNEFAPRASPVGEQHAGDPPVNLGDGNRFHPATADLTLQRDGVHIRFSPLLSFGRLSPDGFWSVLAPGTLASERRKVRGHSLNAGIQVFDYSDGSAVLFPEPTQSGLVELTAYTPVRADAFSHLNSFCVLEVSGHERLSLTFSPCRETMIDVLPADYPTGRPGRFAYLDESGEFFVVEASSGEKGPFHRLASGSLARGEPLSIALHDDGRLIASIRFEDWSRQASTALSPTAGWCVPINAIEFQRLDTEEDPFVTVWMTLAATSVGRGWESVGHRAGTYRNRVVFKVD